MTWRTVGSGRSRPDIQRIIKVLAVVLAAGLALGAALVWSDTPPRSDNPDVFQITGSCCTPGGAPAITISSGYDEIPGAEVMLFPLGGPNSIKDGRVSLAYDLFTWTADPKDTGVKTPLTDTGLRIGDTVTHGPVTLEIVAIHDALLDRNDAVDLRVTFDLDRVDEMP